MDLTPSLKGLRLEAFSHVRCDVVCPAVPSCALRQVARGTAFCTNRIAVLPPRHISRPWHSTLWSSTVDRSGHSAMHPDSQCESHVTILCWVLGRCCQRASRPWTACSPETPTEVRYRHDPHRANLHCGFNSGKASAQHAQSGRCDHTARAMPASWCVVAPTVK